MQSVFCHRLLHWRDSSLLWQFAAHSDPLCLEKASPQLALLPTFDKPLQHFMDPQLVTTPKTGSSLVNKSNTGIRRRSMNEVVALLTESDGGKTSGKQALTCNGCQRSYPSFCFNRKQRKEDYPIYWAYKMRDQSEPQYNFQDPDLDLNFFMDSAGTCPKNLSGEKHPGESCQFANFMPNQEIVVSESSELLPPASLIQ